MIEIHKQEHIKDTAGAREDWAKVTGHPVMLKPAMFRHVETGQYYCNIVGGIAYPAAVGPEIRPGVVIIIGVQNEPTVLFRVLESFESKNVFELIEQVIILRKKYGFGLDSRILPDWYGDQEKYLTIVVKASEALERKIGEGQGLYIKDMVDLREKHAFPLYVRQLYNARKTGRLEAPADTGDIILTQHLKNFQPQDAEKGKTEDFPAVGLLGGMIHSLQIQKPWLEATDGQGTVFNIDI